MVPFKTSYNQELDSVKSYYLIGLAFVLAVLFHSNLNKSVVGDFLWAFTQYLETFAILSQFVLFRNKVVVGLLSKATLSRILRTSWRRRPSREFCS